MVSNEANEGWRSKVGGTINKDEQYKIISELYVQTQAQQNDPAAEMRLKLFRANLLAVRNAQANQLKQTA